MIYANNWNCPKGRSRHFATGHCCWLRDCFRLLKTTQNFNWKTIDKEYPIANNMICHENSAKPRVQRNWSEYFCFLFPEFEWKITYIWVYCCLDEWIHSHRWQWCRRYLLVLRCLDLYHRRLCCSHSSLAYDADSVASLRDAILLVDLKTKPGNSSLNNKKTN